jgi:hypothetical protein
MNCEEVKANLSPYVAGDIEEASARETIDAHLRECASCRAVAVEWEASHQLLRLHQPPEFDAAFFDSVRRGVMRQISEPRPSLFARLLGQPFGQRTLTYAAVFSLLVCAAVLTSHFLRRSPTPAVEVAKGDKDGPVKVKTNDTQKSGHQADEGATKNDESAAPRPQTTPAPQRRARPAVAALKRAARAEKLTAPPETRDAGQESSAQGVQGVASAAPVREPNGTDAGSPKHVETAAAPREMFRIELQTKDPNVRIIWLSPRPATEGDSSNNPTDKR